MLLATARSGCAWLEGAQLGHSWTGEAVSSPGSRSAENTSTSTVTAKLGQDPSEPVTLGMVSPHPGRPGPYTHSQGVGLPRAPAGRTRHEGGSEGVSEGVGIPGGQGAVSLL